MPDLSDLTIERQESAPASNKWLGFSSKQSILVLIVLSALSFYWLFNQPLDTQQNLSTTKGQLISVPVSVHRESWSKVSMPKSSTPFFNKTSKDKQVQSNSSKLAKVLDASGHIVARRIATVSSRVTGKLQKLYIEEGMQVKQSQILAELDEEQAMISFKLARAEMKAKKASVEEANLVLDHAMKQSQRTNKLAENDLISIQGYETSQFKVDQIRAQLNNKKALLSLAEKRVELAQYLLNHHKIRAPFNGIVISKNAQVGELISTGSSAGGSIRTGVGTIVDMESLEIEVDVGESYINRVFPGQPAIATLDAYPEWEIKSEVITVIPTADKQKASIKVRIKLMVSDKRIFPDMGVKVSFFDPLS